MGKIYVADDVLYIITVDSADYALSEKGRREIKAEVTFTAKEANGTVEIPFTFDGTGLEGTTFVVFEELYLVKDDKEHVGQSIRILTIQIRPYMFRVSAQRLWMQIHRRMW